MVAQGVPGRLRPRIFLTFGITGVVGRQPYTPATLPQKKSLVLIFRGWVDLRAHGSIGGSHGKNPQWHHRESIPGPSDKYRSALTTTLPQAPTEMSTRDISWVCKGGLRVWLTVLPSSCHDCFEIWQPQLPEAPVACPNLYRDCFTLTCTQNWHYATSAVLLFVL